MKFFYHKIIIIESIAQELHSMDLSDQERSHLANLVDSSLHAAILHEVLSNLNEQDKRIFVKLLTQDPEGERIWEFLNKKVDKIEDKIKKTADDLIVDLHKDIKDAKRLKGNQK